MYMYCWLLSNKAGQSPTNSHGLTLGSLICPVLTTCDQSHWLLYQQLIGWSS